MKGLNHIDPNEKNMCACVCVSWIGMGVWVGWFGTEPALYQDPIAAACIGGPATSLWTTLCVSAYRTHTHAHTHKRTQFDPFMRRLLSRSDNRRRFSRRVPDLAAASSQSFHLNRFPAMAPPPTPTGWKRPGSVRRCVLVVTCPTLPAAVRVSNAPPAPLVFCMGCGQSDRGVSGNTWVNFPGSCETAEWIAPLCPSWLWLDRRKHPTSWESMRLWIMVRKI